MNMVLVSDQPKGRDDVPNDRFSSRLLYKQIIPTGDPEKDAQANKWVPQKFRFDPDRKQSWAELDTSINIQRLKTAKSAPVSGSKTKGKGAKTAAVAPTQAGGKERTGGKGKK